jgi:Phosphotransferase enzyme family
MSGLPGVAPLAQGRRLPWSSIPADLRAEVERVLGGRVTAAVTQPGGFSPGVAARLQLSSGRRAFVKAVGDLNPDSPAIHRTEARITGALPPGTPAPRLLGCIDSAGWVILLLEDIEGRTPALPWQPGELDRVLAGLADLAASLTPSPVDAPAAADRLPGLSCGWRRLGGALARGDTGPPPLEPWAARHLDRLAGLEAGWAAGSRGDSLVHGDIRADNVLLTRDGVVFVDWPWACVAAPWLDLVAMLPSVVMQGGPPPDQVLDRHPVARGADPDAVTALIAGLAGEWSWLCRQPAPPGLPTLRAFQAAQADVCLAWLRARTGWR